MPAFSSGNPGQDQQALQFLRQAVGAPNPIGQALLSSSPSTPPAAMTGAGGSDPMDQNIMKLLNKYWGNRQGRSQLEMLAMGGSQSTPLRSAAGVPNLMDRSMPPFTPQNVTSGVSPIGLPPPGAAPAPTPGANSGVSPREAAGTSLMNWINSENRRLNNPTPHQTDWTLFAPRETPFDLALDQARLAGF